MWADILAGWAENKTRSMKYLIFFDSDPLMCAPINSGVDYKLDWSISNEIPYEQRMASSTPPRSFSKLEDIFSHYQRVFWIPNESEKLKLRIIVAEHTRQVGHRSTRFKLATVEAHFYWKNMSADVEFYVRSGIHCL